MADISYRQQRVAGVVGTIVGVGVLGVLARLVVLYAMALL